MKQPVLNLDLYLEIERIKEEKDQEAENQTRPTTGATDPQSAQKDKVEEVKKEQTPEEAKKATEPGAQD